MDIILSVYPKYNELIKQGVKNFEFRPFELESDTGVINMWVYETKPTMALKYLMVVKNPVSKLRTGSNYGLGNERFYDVISSGRVGYEIVKFYKLKDKLELQKMKKLGLNDPQNFAYLDKYPKVKEELKKNCIRKNILENN